jgi:hypothetical protein
MVLHLAEKEKNCINVVTRNTTGEDSVIVECLDFLEKHEFMRLQATEGEDKPIK